MFPEPSGFTLVLFKHFGTDDHQATIAIRTQTVVGIKQHTGAGRRSEPVVQPLRKAAVYLQRLLRRIIKYEHQVQIRGITHLFTTQFAVGNDGKFRHIAVFFRKRIPAMIQGRIQHYVGQIGQVIGQLFHRPQTVQLLHQQAKYLAVVVFAQNIHLPFHIRFAVVVFGMIEQLIQVRLERRPIGCAVQLFNVEQLIQQNGVRRQIVGDKAGTGQQLDQAFQSLWVLDQ